MSLLSAGKRSPKTSKKHVVLRCLSDRLHIDVTVFPFSKNVVAEAVGFFPRFLGSGGGVGEGENSISESSQPDAS